MVANNTWQPQLTDLGWRMVGVRNSISGSWEELGVSRRCKRASCELTKSFGSVKKNTENSDTHPVSSLPGGTRARRRLEPPRRGTSSMNSTQGEFLDVVSSAG